MTGGAGELGVVGDAGVVENGGVVEDCVEDTETAEDAVEERRPVGVVDGRVQSDVERRLSPSSMVILDGSTPQSISSLAISPDANWNHKSQPREKLTSQSQRQTL